MIKDEDLLKNLSNGLESEIKRNMLNDYKKEVHGDGYEKGWNAHEKIIISHRTTLRQNAKKVADEQIDQLRDIIFTNKQTITK